MPQQGNKPLPILSIEEAYSVFRLDRQSERVRPSTLRFYEWTLRPFFAWLETQGVTCIGEIANLHIRGYLVEKQTLDKGKPTEREASAHYLHDIARAIRAFVRFCVDEGWIVDSPMRNVKMPRKPNKILAAYTDGEIKKLLAAAADDRERAVILFLLDTGARISEVCGVTAGDIQLSTNSVLIRAGKGEKDRHVYFGAKTAKALIRVTRGLQPGDYVWANRRTGKRLMYRGLAKTLRQLGERAHVHCTAHKFRRTFAINSLRNGMNIYTLAQLMGHSDITILKPYLDLLRSDLRAGHQQFGVVDNL